MVLMQAREKLLLCPPSHFAHPALSGVRLFKNSSKLDFDTKTMPRSAPGLRTRTSLIAPRSPSSISDVRDNPDSRSRPRGGGSLSHSASASVASASELPNLDGIPPATVGALVVSPVAQNFPGF